MPIATTKTVYTTADGSEFATHHEACLHEVVDALTNSPRYVGHYDREAIAEFLLSKFDMVAKSASVINIEDPDHGEQIA
jgi:hypothetical protein